MARSSWLLLPLLTLTLAAQHPAPAARTGNGPAPAAAPAAEAPDPKPYDKVITPEAKTQTGLFTVHQLKGKVYFELPEAVLGRELLLAATMAEAPQGVDHAGKLVNENVVRFVRQDNRIYFQTVSHALVSDPGKPIAPAVAASQRDAVLLAFNVEALAKDGAAVIDVTRLFTTEVGDFSARQDLNATGQDAGRSYVTRVKSFPRNLRVDAVQTYTLAANPPGAAPPQGQPAPPPRSGSVLMAYSFVALPETVMPGRLFDDRVGFFTVGRVDYGSEAHETRAERLITRWRLEKKDPTAALSEPVKPIVWYIDKATPAQWAPYIKKGVEAWNVAFEAAGFKNAVQARPFPTAQEDPEFDPEDLRYSIIRWVPSPVANAYGPHIADPRSGEILNADIVLYHNIQQLQRDWYFTQVGPLDPRAAKLPLPDSLMGDLLAYVVTHECGHSLGFPHNMKASSTYPLEKLRDKEWLKTMGHVPTLMDYARFNYVVQPEDGIDPELLRPKIGPYDIFAVKWGYTPIPEAKDPRAEQPLLDRWARVQDDTPWLRFSTPRANGSDPGENTEAVGDADAVQATTLGIRNLKRVLAMLPAAGLPATDSDEELQHLYRALWNQWGLELGHVTAIVGGFQSQNKHLDQPGPIWTPETRTRQDEAVRFLNDNLFRTPQWLLDQGLLSRLPPGEGGRRLLAAQRRVLAALLLDHERSHRLQEHEALLGSQAYRLADLLDGLRAGVFTELAAPAPKIEPARRNLQRTYLDLLDERLNRPDAHAGEIPDDARALMAAQLKGLQAQLATRNAADPVTRAHLAELRVRIGRILEPRLPLPAAPAAQPARRTGLDCWPASDPGLQDD